MDVFWNGGTPKSFILVGFPISKSSILGTLMETHNVYIYICVCVFYDLTTNNRDWMVDVGIL